MRLTEFVAIATVIILFLISPKVDADYPACTTRVIDGDTYDMEVIIQDHFDNPFALRISKNIRVRLKDFDTPETWRPKSEAEKIHGEKATAFTKTLLDNKCIVLRNLKEAAYNRFEADVVFPDNDKSLADILRANGFEKKSFY